MRMHQHSTRIGSKSDPISLLFAFAIITLAVLPATWAKWSLNVVCWPFLGKRGLIALLAISIIAL